MNCFNPSQVGYKLLHLVILFSTYLQFQSLTGRLQTSARLGRGCAGCLFQSLTGRLQTSEASKAIMALMSGRYEDAAKRINSVVKQFSSLEASFRALYSYASPRQLGRVGDLIRNSISVRLSELSGKISDLSDVGFIKMNKSMQMAINSTNRFLNVLSGLLVAAKSFAIFFIASFFSISRVLYTVNENLSTAYRLMVDLGVSLPASFAITVSIPHR